MEEDLEAEIQEKEITVGPEILALAEKNKIVMTSNPICSGCGSVLGLKIALQIIDNPVLVVSSGDISLFGRYKSLSVPFVHAGLNAAAVASGLARAGGNVLVYAGDGATNIHLSSVLAAARRNDNILYVCYNNRGYDNIQSTGNVFSNTRNIEAAYAATASVSHIEDYIKKLKKAAAMTGFRFIEVLCPCPAAWGYDASNTMEVARLAVETASWVLYEIIDDKIEITSRPPKIEPVERYVESHSMFNEKEIIKLKEAVNKNLKLLQKK
ncbi:MAG: hypothetical protein HYT72_00995 [Candidatus Aenigmarchaeota archaeon]|nr:hypothetical protein [Candidatus Aenigmarchaeota archaeon]